MDGKHSSPTLVLFHLGVITSGTHSPVKMQSIKSRNNSILQKCGVKHMERPYFPVQREKNTLKNTEKLSLETAEQMTVTADEKNWLLPCRYSTDARLSQTL